LIGIAVRRMPPRLLDPMFDVLRRVSIPDLSAKGLPRPSAPFSQFRSTATVPIFDVGFVDAVRDGSIEVVPVSRRLTAGPLCWLTEHGCIRRLFWRPPATVPILSRSSAMSHRSDRTASQAPNPAFTSLASAFRSLVCCTKSARTPSGWHVISQPKLDVAAKDQR
jgi:hypothetical protein